MTTSLEDAHQFVANYDQKTILKFNNLNFSTISPSSIREWGMDLLAISWRELKLPVEIGVRC
jgi:hypothetical protein